jgi:hypothetical protein
MIIEAILKINPNAEVSVLGDDINTCEITWHNGTTPIPIADIQAQFKVVEFEIAIGNLREKRNSLLAKTDWTSSSDLTMSDAMRTYRQQLRDAPNGLDTVEKVQAYEFPTEVLK